MQPAVLRANRTPTRRPTKVLILRVVYMVHRFTGDGQACRTSGRTLLIKWHFCLNCELCQPRELCMTRVLAILLPRLHAFFYSLGFLSKCTWMPQVFEACIWLGHSSEDARPGSIEKFVGCGLTSYPTIKTAISLRGCSMLFL